MTRLAPTPRIRERDSQRPVHHPGDGQSIGLSALLHSPEAPSSEGRWTCPSSPGEDSVRRRTPAEAALWSGTEASVGHSDSLKLARMTSSDPASPRLVSFDGAPAEHDPDVHDIEQV